VFANGKPFQLWVRQGAYPIVEPLKSDSLRSATTLLTNIRLGRKSIPGTNTLAYYELSLNYGRKKFHNIDASSGVKAHF
jgi:hypothetical protein